MFIVEVAETLFDDSVAFNAVPVVCKAPASSCPASIGEYAG